MKKMFMAIASRDCSMINVKILISWGMYTHKRERDPHWHKVYGREIYVYMFGKRYLTDAN